MIAQVVIDPDGCVTATLDTDAADLPIELAGLAIDDLLDRQAAPRSARGSPCTATLSPSWWTRMPTKPEPAAQGSPTSATCRWCGTNRPTHAGALICRVCDQPPGGIQ